MTINGQKSSKVVERDVRASLILNLLLRPLIGKRQGPNLTHLLLGFNLEAGISNTHIDIMSFSPLQVMSEALYQYKCHITWPQEIEQMLQLISQLLSDPPTSGATLELLRSLENNYFMDVLHEALISPIPHDSPDRIYYIWQIKWILQIHATALHKSLPEVQQEKEDCGKLLHGLIGDAVKSETTSLPYCAILMALQFCKNALQFEKPALKQDMRLMHLQRQMQVDLLLSAPELVSEGGIRTITERGVTVYHIPSLGNILARLFKDLEVNCGWSLDSEERVRASQVLEETLRYAQSHNVFSQIAHAIQELLSSWEQLLSVTFSRHDGLAMKIQMAPTGSTGFQSLLLLATSSLEALDFVSSTSNAHLSQPLARVTNILMASVLKHTKDVVASGVLYQGINSDTLDVASCHKFLTVLVNCLSKPADKVVRQYLYGSLIFYLMHTKVTKTPDLPAMILEKYEDLDERFDLSSLQHLDGAHEILDQGNMSIMQQQASRLVQAFFQDIVDGVYFTKALALHALSMLIAADPLGTILQEVLSCGVIVSLVRDLDSFPAIVNPMQQSLPIRDLYIFKAILTLYLEVACSKEGCLMLASSGVIRSLGSSKVVESALDCIAGPLSGVAQLQEISMLTLQILLALSVGLPESRDVATDVRDFLERHSKSLFSCLNKNCLPIAGLIMPILSNLFRGPKPLDSFFVAQYRGHIVNLAWELLPPNDIKEIVQRMHENVGHDHCESLMDITVSALECLKMVSVEAVTMDLLETSLQGANEILGHLTEIKVQISSNESSLAKRIDQATSVERLLEKARMIVDLINALMSSLNLK